MGRVTKLWFLLPRPVRRFPPDLAAVIGLVVASGLAASLPGVRESVLRVLVGAPFVLLLPGYAVTAALFPRSGATDAGNGGSSADDGRVSAGDGRSSADNGQSSTGDDWSSTDDGRANAGFLRQSREGITLLERLLFSVGVSVTVVPLVGFALNFTPWGIGFASLGLSIGGFTVAMALLAAVRRWEAPPEERFRVPVGEWYDSVHSELFESTSRLEAVLNAVILVSMLVALGSGAYAVLGPQEDQSFTKFYLLGENETGDLIADDYPEAVGEGQNGTVVVGIDNHEHRTVEYSVVVRLQRVEMRNGTPVVADSRQVDQFRVEVPANETVRRRHTVTPQSSGEQLQLQYLLYVDDPPANPTAGNAYRSVHVWVNATTQ